MSRDVKSKQTAVRRLKEMAFKSAKQNGASAAFATYKQDVMGAVKTPVTPSEMTKEEFLAFGKLLGENTYKTDKAKNDFYIGWEEATEALIRLNPDAFKRVVKTWRIEIRRESDGYTETEDYFEGTEGEAIAEGENWLREALTLDPYQKDVYVTEKDNPDNVAYCGTFDMLPSGEYEAQIGDIMIYEDPENCYMVNRFVGSTDNQPHVKKWILVTAEQTVESLSAYLEKEGLTPVKLFGRKQTGYYRKTQEQQEKEQAETRAKTERVIVYVVRTARGLFVCTEREIYTHHAMETTSILYVANPVNRFEEEQQVKEPAPTLDMERIGKQYILIDGEQVTGIIYTPNYATGVARIKGRQDIRVKFYKNAEGAHFPIPEGESCELKSIWIPIK